MFAIGSFRLGVDARSMISCCSVWVRSGTGDKRYGRTFWSFRTKHHNGDDALEDVWSTSFFYQQALLISLLSWDNYPFSVPAAMFKRAQVLENVST